MGLKLVRKIKPDESRSFDKGKMEVFFLGDSKVGRGEFEPGWRWSHHVKPTAGTPSCACTHTGYVLEGQMVVKMDDGSEMEYGVDGGSLLRLAQNAEAAVQLLHADIQCRMFDGRGLEENPQPKTPLVLGKSKRSNDPEYLRRIGRD